MVLFIFQLSDHSFRVAWGSSEFATWFTAPIRGRDDRWSIFRTVFSFATATIDDDVGHPIALSASSSTPDSQQSLLSDTLTATAVFPDPSGSKINHERDENTLALFGLGDDDR
jgi:hypothetical protein